MAKEWGFEDEADGDNTSGLNPFRKMAKANPMIGAARKYADNPGNMLEQSGGGDGAPLPLLPESGRREENQGTKKTLSPVPDPDDTPAVPTLPVPGQGNGYDGQSKYRMLFPDGPVDGIERDIVKPGNRTGDDGIIMVPESGFRDDDMLIVPKPLNGGNGTSGFNKPSGNPVRGGNPGTATGRKNEAGPPAGAAIGAESANPDDLSRLFGNGVASSEKQNGPASRSGSHAANTPDTSASYDKTRPAIDWEHADPVYWLVEKESENRVKRTEKILQPFFVQSSDMAKGLADAKNARFDPEGLTWYSKEEREFMQALMDAHIAVANSEFDPVMAQKQAYPFLNRLNSASVAAAGGDLSGIRQGSYSFDTLRGQVATLLYKGTQPDLRLSQTVANAMNSLDNTAWGSMTRNFMGSVHRGMVNLTENSINTALGIMSSAPPAEIAMFHYRQMYIAHGNDTAGMARELENMAGFAGKLQQSVSGEAARVKGLYGDMRTPEYNRLEWLTLDPGRAAWMRPDKMTGDLFEKLLPAILGVKGVSKAGEVMDLARRGSMFIKGAYAVNTGYTNAWLATRREMLSNPGQMERDPDYIRYRKETTLPEARAREIYAEAKARQSGIQAGLLTLVTFTGTSLFRQASDTGADHPVIQLFKQIVGAQSSMMAKEAFTGARSVDYGEKARRRN